LEPLLVTGAQPGDGGLVPGPAPGHADAALAAAQAAGGRGGVPAAGTGCRT
jgi:hypothetical protein